MITTATNAEYDDQQGQWSLTRAFSTGEGARAYLRQGAFEADERFAKRKLLADFHPLTASLIRRITGQLYKEEITREAPIDLQDVGAGGESMQVVAIDIAQTLLAYNAAVIVIDDGVRVLPPLSCPRWGPQFFTITGTESAQAGPTEDQEEEDVWTVYTPAQAEIYAQTRDKSTGKKKDVFLRTAEYAEGRAYTLSGSPHPPAIRPTMSWPTAIGYEIAKAHRAIYRMESRADAGEMEAAASTMMQAAVGDDEDFAEIFAKALKKGQNYVPYSEELGQHLPFSLPVGPSDRLRETLETKEERLYKVLGQAVAQNAQRSATEAMLDLSTGIAPLLTTLAAKLEDVERQVIELAAQEQDTRRMGARAQDITVEYPADFANIDLTSPDLRE